MDENYIVLIDNREFQTKVLDFISSEDFDKIFNSTRFVGNHDCRQAMIHGMCLASLLTSMCKYIIVKKPLD